MRALLILWRLTEGHRLAPWKSPYLRWRIETYSGLHAEQIDSTVFWKFAKANWRELWRYAKWAGKMDHAHRTE